MNSYSKMGDQYKYGKYGLDTITRMKKYNFHLPISTSILYEDNEKEPNEVIDLQDNNLKIANLQTESHNLDLTVHQQNLYTDRNRSTSCSEINPYHRLYSDDVRVSKQNSNFCQKYTVCKNTETRNPYIKKPYTNSKKVHLNNNSKEESSVLCNSQINENIPVYQVAINLALIVKAYMNYGKLTFGCGNKQYTARIRDKYLRVKYFYLNKSLSISEKCLLQHENNQQFIKNLLHKVVDLSKVTPHEFPYNYLMNLYNDLLKWTKFKKHQLTNNVPENLRPSGISPAEMSLPNVDHSSENGDYNMRTRKFFSCGQPGSQITISVDPTIIAQYRNTFNAQNQSACPTKINDSGQNFINFAKTDSTNMRIENNVTQHISYTNISTIDDINRQNLQSTHPRVPFESSSMYVTENDKCMLNNDTQKCGYNTMFTEGIQMNLQDTTRSSISRDSGFTSPVTSGSPSEYMYNTVQQQSSQYAIDTSALQMPNTTIEPDFAQEISCAWKSIEPYL